MRENTKSLLSYIPADSLDLIESWIQGIPLQIVITRSRKTKLGTYWFNPKTGQHKITLNHDLNRWHFLFVFVHEIAHLKVNLKYGRRVKPHGIEWKKEFSVLLHQIATEVKLPEDIRLAYYAHAKNPKASSSTDIELNRVLIKYDNIEEGTVLLKEVALNSKFIGPRESLFTKLESRRTRALCRSEINQKLYLISESLLVKTA